MGSEAATSLPLGRDSVTYRVTLEPVTVLVGGPRALLLQVSQAVVAAGVAQFSDYERDPYSRLVRTLRAMTQLSVGSPEQSAEVSRLLRRSHATIRGELDDGTPYRALDPEHMRWVWATLLDTLIAVHEAFVRPLSRAEREQLYDEWLLVAEGCGIDRAHCPTDHDAFVDYVAETIEHDLSATEPARRVAALLGEPPLPGPLAGVAGLVFSVLVPGLLPPRLRAELGYRWDPVRATLFEAMAAASRAVAFVVPGPVRRLPTAITRIGNLALPPPKPRRRVATA